MYAWLRHLEGDTWQVRLTAGRPQKFNTRGGLHAAMDIASAILRDDDGPLRQSTHAWEIVGPEYCTTV